MGTKRPEDVIPPEIRDVIKEIISLYDENHTRLLWQKVRRAGSNDHTLIIDFIRLEPESSREAGNELTDSTDAEIAALLHGKRQVRTKRRSSKISTSEESSSSDDEVFKPNSSSVTNSVTSSVNS